MAAPVIVRPQTNGNPRGMDESLKITKHKIAVELELDDGRKLLGGLFVQPQKRLSDMLNDDRQFLPFETTDGRFMALAKTAIRAVLPIGQEVKEYEGNNPYQILGVSDCATPDEIKAAYRALCAENHPDKLKAAGLSGQLLDIATQRMARINDAYRRLQEQMGSNQADAA
jgi:DnaJ-domain-containing protein 1